jgi:hypothetical protein
VTRRVIWFVPFAGLIALLAVTGLRLGWIASSLSETDVINKFVGLYLGEAGARAQPTDCIAFPSQSRGIWIVVRCEGGVDTPSRIYEYHVNRLGGLEYSGTPKSPSQSQEELDA